MNRKTVLLSMLACSLFLSSFAAGSYKPLLAKGKEFGYVLYSNQIENNPSARLTYYRLVVGEKTNLDGKEYSDVSTAYAPATLPGSANAFLREEDGKVLKPTGKENYGRAE